MTIALRPPFDGYRLVKRGVHLWWQYLEPRVFISMGEMADMLWGWEPVA